MSAIISAASVEIACPMCGEGQTEPDSGSFAWMLSDLKSIAGRTMECRSCGEKFVVRVGKTVTLGERS